MRSQAYVFRFAKITVAIGRKEGLDGPLTVSELEAADKVLFRFVQRAAFGKELEMLKNGELLDKESAIHDLSPYIDDDDILRQLGRIDVVEGVSKEAHNLAARPSNNSFDRQRLSPEISSSKQRNGV